MKSLALLLINALSVAAVIHLFFSYPIEQVAYLVAPKSVSLSPRQPLDSNVAPCSNPDWQAAVSAFGLVDISACLSRRPEASADALPMDWETTRFAYATRDDNQHTPFPLWKEGRGVPMPMPRPPELKREDARRAIESSIRRIEGASNASEIAQAVFDVLAVEPALIPAETNRRLTIALTYALEKMNRNAELAAEQRANKAVVEITTKANEAITAANNAVIASNSATDFSRWALVIVGAFSAFGIFFGAWHNRLAFKMMKEERATKSANLPVS